MEYVAILAGIDVVLAAALTFLALRAWVRARDPRAAWMALAMLSLLAMAAFILWQAWTQALDPVWTWMAVAEAFALASLYVGALR